MAGRGCCKERGNGMSHGLKVDQSIIESLARAFQDDLRAIKVLLDRKKCSLNCLAVLPATENIEQDVVHACDLCEDALPCFLLILMTTSPMLWVLINWVPDDASAFTRADHQSAHATVKGLLRDEFAAVVDLKVSDREELSYTSLEQILKARDEEILQANPVVRDRIEVTPVQVQGVGDRKLCIVVMSDTHNLIETIPAHLVPDGDVLLHCGDFTNHGTAEEVERFDSYMADLFRSKSYRRKLVIGGNHDVGNFSETPFAKKSVLTSMEYLADGIVHVEGLKVYGCSWNMRGSRKVPDGIDILITHEPPSGILDCGIGCDFLLEDVAKAKPKLHVFGHVHPGNGFQKGSDEVASTTFVNAALAGGQLEDLRSARELTRSIMVLNLEP